jgi:lipoate-protein ligase A
LDEKALAEIQNLKETKYDTWEWNFGKSPKFDLTNKRRFDGGTLEVGFRVEKGVITEAAFFGDFLSVTSLEPLTEGLKGCPFRKAEVRGVLETFPLREMFGTIRCEEILETVFHAGDLAGERDF